MVKKFELRGRVEFYFKGPETFNNIQHLQVIAKGMETEDDKISTMNVGFWRDEVKEKTEVEVKKKSST